MVERRTSRSRIQLPQFHTLSWRGLRDAETSVLACRLRAVQQIAFGTKSHTNTKNEMLHAHCSRALELAYTAHQGILSRELYTSLYGFTLNELYTREFTRV